MVELGKCRMLVTVDKVCWDEFLSRHPKPYPDFVDHDHVRSWQQYELLADRYSYDCVVVWFGGALTLQILND
jgi:hypothetical protein